MAVITGFQSIDVVRMKYLSKLISTKRSKFKVYKYKRCVLRKKVRVAALERRKDRQTERGRERERSLLHAAVPVLPRHTHVFVLFSVLLF